MIDPDLMLSDALVIARRVFDGDLLTMELNDAHELAARLLDLDEWLKQGGAPPKAWQKETK